MSKKKARDRRRSRRPLVVVVLFACVVALVLFKLGLMPWESDVDVQVVTERVEFQYRPQDARAGDAPLLSHTKLLHLAASSISSIHVTQGEISVRDDVGTRWTSPVSAATVRILAPTPLAKALFDDVVLERLATTGDLKVTFTATPHDASPGLLTMLEGGQSSISLSGADQIEFDCHRCQIVDSTQAGMNAPVALTRRVRLSGLSGTPIVVTGGQRRLLLDLTVEPSALTGEQFQVTKLAFCEGKPAEPGSSVLSARVSFPAQQSSKTTELTHGVLVMAPVSTFTLSDLVLVADPSRVGVPHAYALSLRLTGLTQAIGVASRCNAEPDSWLPSQLDHLRSRPWALALAGAVAVLGTAGAFYTKLRAFFDSLRAS